MITVQIIGKERLLVRFAELSRKMVRAVNRALQEGAYAVEKRTKEKLSGNVLNVRTGRLRRSIHTTELSGATDSKVFAVGTDVVYAAPHEFGFNGTVTVKEHMRRAVAKARTGRSGKKEAGGATTVRAHSRHLHLPERSFLRSSLKELGAQIKQDVLNAAREAGRGET